MKNKIFLSLVILLLSSIAFGQVAWERLTAPSSQSKFDTKFVNSDTGWVVGSGATVWKTANGGKTWTEYDFGTSIMKSVFAFSKDTVFVVRNGTPNLVYKTYNFGEDWEFDTVQMLTSSGSIFFINSEKGFIAGDDDYGDANINITTDGGETWIADTVGYAEDLRDIYFPDNQTGWTVGNHGRIWKTTDGGDNWTLQTSDYPTYNGAILNSVYFSSADTGWIAGNYGVILKTVNGGTDWDTVKVGYNGHHIMDIQFIGNKVGWAVLLNIYSEDGKILKSKDGGNTWFVDYETEERMRALSVVDSTHIWTVGDGGYIYKYADTTSYPEISLSAYDLDIGNVYVGSCDSSFFNIKNEGEADLIISGVNSDNEKFTVGSAPDTITAGDSQDVYIKFSPVSPGIDTAVLTISSNDNKKDTVTVTVYGTGVGPDINLSTKSLDFGPIDIGTGKSDTVKIYNTGNDTLFISGMSSSDTVFTVNESSASVPAGDTHNMIITYSPVEIGYDTSIITIICNDYDEDTLTVTAAGYGLPLYVIASLPDTTASKGAVFYLPVTVSNVQANDSILSYQFKLGYNSSFIEFSDYDTAGTLSDNFSINYSTSITDTLMLSAAANDYPVNGDGILLKLGFSFKPAFTFDDTANFVFKDFMFNEGTPDDSTVNGTVRMDSCLYGDVSLNGEITAYDASLALGYTVAEESLSDAAKTAADVSASGTVTAYDASLILRYLTGIITEFPVGSEKFVPKTDLTNARLLVDIKSMDGETVEYVIVLNNAEQVFSSEFGVEYTNMELLGIEKTEATEEYQISEKRTQNIVKIALAGIKPVKSENEIIKIKFKLLTGIPALKVVNALLNETRINTAGIEETLLPKTFGMEQNYPNPFNPETSIKYQLPEAASVTLKIYNMLGQEVKTIVNSSQKAGYYNVKWNGTNTLGMKVSSGIYIYRIKAGKFIKSKKMVYLR